jgi:predicted small secreted protein
MSLSKRLGVVALALSGFMLAGCQTTAGTGGEGGTTVQMARDDGRSDLVTAATRRRVQDLPPRIYLMRGLANVFSQGMDDLGDKLRARGYNATVHEYGAWPSIAAEILANQRASGGRHQAVVMGHSLGANAVTELVNAVGQSGGSLALAVAFDPTVQQQVSGGARRYINLYQSNNGWGTTVSAAPGFRGRVENVDLRGRGTITHFNIDKDPGLHAQVISWVGQAVGGPRRGARQAEAR